MQWIKTIFREVFGLFVDDGSFALAILAWLLFIWLLLRRLQMPIAGGILLFLGLAALLIESVARFSRSAASSRS